MVYKRKKNVQSNGMKKGTKTKRKIKDLDEIDNDLKEENARKLLNQDVDFDKPGSAQFYCIHCARYFINDRALEDHFTTKVHKRRMKALEDEPYTIEESERAAGHGNWISSKKRKIETLPRDAFNEIDVPKTSSI
ncbi:zinc finger protein 593 [Fopius arisanus]|uniref:Zinc finger protein 593 homolog n=1 Tax=Fopius arisanus TaxID=64838 RepID=A0A9R1STZ7_9HYME|nr:PREDICTED: zinc finger protein 593 [Fopius arisanus]